MNTKRVTGLVRWFNQYKGYGFLDVDGIDEDVFVHFSLIDRMGYKELKPRDFIDCEIEKSGKGYHVKTIFEIRAAEDSHANCIRKMECMLKWFNPAKGYGFAETKDGEDVFIHSSLLRSLNIESIECGAKLVADVCKQKRGYEAISLQVVE